MENEQLRLRILNRERVQRYRARQQQLQQSSFSYYIGHPQLPLHHQRSHSNSESSHFIPQHPPLDDHRRNSLFNQNEFNWLQHHHSHQSHHVLNHQSFSHIPHHIQTTSDQHIHHQHPHYILPIPHDQHGHHPNNDLYSQYSSHLLYHPHINHDGQQSHQAQYSSHLPYDIHISQHGNPNPTVQHHPPQQINQRAFSSLYDHSALTPAIDMSPHAHQHNSIIPQTYLINTINAPQDDSNSRISIRNLVHSHDIEIHRQTTPVFDLVPGWDFNEEEPPLPFVEHHQPELPLDDLNDQIHQQDNLNIEFDDADISHHTIYPVAWGWVENPSYTSYTLPPTRNCQYCHALLFNYETSSLCCCNGKLILPQDPPPQDLLQIFKNSTAATSQSQKEFIQNIRLINSNFSFTSLGVNQQTQSALNRQNQGVYTFKVTGTIHHNIGSLLPIGENPPKFLQLYIYDTQNELENRHRWGQNLSRHLIQSIQNILHCCNRYIHQFQHLSSEITPNRSIQLSTNATNLDQRVYNLPTVDQVAAVWIEGNDPAQAGNREVIIHHSDGSLRRISEMNEMYDPLHYVLLHPTGQSGWYPELQESHGMNKATAMNYYAHRLAFRNQDYSLLNWGGRLFQQYCVDQYIKIETHRLNYIRFHQAEFRIEQFYGVVDAFQNGLSRGNHTGIY